MTKIIAEIASGHNGDLELAKAMIRAGAENGADFIKFQDWRASNVPDGDSDKNRYEKYQFPDAWYPILIPFCKEKGVQFLTTCFNADRAKFLADQGLKTIKLASISLTNHELIKWAGAYFEHIIISTAMHNKEEIEEAINLLVTNCQKFTIMHCVANYPAKLEVSNLERINELKKMVVDYPQASVGFSDHSLDPQVSMAAISMGISHLEKHFSLSRYLPQIPHEMLRGGPLVTTHQVSIEPKELRELSIWRDLVQIMYGTGEFKINTTELLIKEKYSNRYGK